MNKKIKIKDIDISKVYKNRKISSSTLRQYKSTFNSLRNSKYGTKNLNSIHLIFIDMRKSKLSSGKLENYMNLLNTAYKYYYGQDNKKSKLIMSSFIKIARKNKDNRVAPKDDDFKEYLTISAKIKKDSDQFDNFSNSKLIDYITMYLYTQLPPRRTDIRFLKIGNKGNFNINLTKKNIQYGPFKNVKESINVDISKHPLLLSMLKKLPKKNIYKETYHSNKPTGQGNFSNYIRRLFKRYYGVSYNIQKLRRLYSLRNYESLEKLKQISKDMGHTLREHQNTYMKKG